MVVSNQNEIGGAMLFPISNPRSKQKRRWEKTNKVLLWKWCMCVGCEKKENRTTHFSSCGCRGCYPPLLVVPPSSPPLGASENHMSAFPPKEEEKKQLGAKWRVKTRREKRGRNRNGFLESYRPCTKKREPNSFGTVVMLRYVCMGGV